MEARRIRISFSDPDATDSDSDDDSTSGAACAASKPTGRTEILILHGNSSILNKMSPAACARRAQPTKPSAALAPAARSSKNRVVSSAPTRRYPGVYERQPGRWAAEFRRHSIKVRHWVGTFATEEEAKAAYDAFERQLLSSPPRCGLPASSPERRGGNAGDVHTSRASPSHPEPDEIRQIVLALPAPTARTTMLPSAAAAGVIVKAASVSVPSSPFISSSTPLSMPPPPFKKNARLCHDVPPSLHSLWADEPIDEDLVGLADLAHLPLPFSDASISMDFDPADLSLFDDGFF